MQRTKDLGGTGINISYEFGVIVMGGDATVEPAIGQVAPYRVVSFRRSTVILI
jgi:hypothetical protein